MSAQGSRIGIVGAGVAGLSVAMHLAERGVSKVTILEAHHPAAGTSGLTVGDISILYEEEADIDVRVLALSFFRQLGQRIGLELVGGLRVATSVTDLVRLEKAAARYRDRGFAASVLEPNELKALVPDMEIRDLAGGLYTPAAGHVDGTLLCGAYLERARSAGAVIRSGTPVTAIDVRDSGFVVWVGDERLEFDLLVNAAGPWAQKVGHLMGVRVPVVPQRHQVCVARLPRPLSYTMPQFQDSFAYVDSATGLYFRPDSASSLLTGITKHFQAEADEVDPDDFVRQVDRTYLEQVARTLASRLPGLPHLTLNEGWCGLYPTTPDNKQIVGPYKSVPGLFAACGLGGAGIQLSPSVGLALAEWILEGQPHSLPDYEHYLPERPMPSEGVIPLA